LLREIADKRFHRWVPKSVETEEIHLLHGLFGAPFFDSHAVNGYKYSGAIVPETAVHKNFLSRIAAEQRKKLRDLLVAWRSPSIDGNMHEAHPQRFGLAVFPGDFAFVLAPQIHDRGYAKLFQFRQPLLSWLCAAIKDFVDFSSVGNPADVKFVTEGRLRRSRRGELSGSPRWLLREKRGSKNAEESEKRKSFSH